jgi:hypothetical protein
MSKSQLFLLRQKITITGQDKSKPNKLTRSNDHLKPRMNLDSSLSLKQLGFSVLVGCTSVISLSFPSLAQYNNPSVVDTLPPAPQIPGLEEIPIESIPVQPMTDYGTLAPPPVSSPYEIREYNFEAPPVPSNTIPSSPIPFKPSGVPLSGYRVEVFGAEPQLLAQIQQIEPNAFIRQGEGTIQAGFFENSWNAEKRVQELEMMGIRSQIVMGTGFVSPPAPNIENLGGKWSDNGYVVVIPSSLEQLPRIASQVRELGLDSRYDIRLRSAPRGPHVAIGLFPNRENAYQWNNLFRSRGLDARVYFGN